MGMRRSREAPSATNTAHSTFLSFKLTRNHGVQVKISSGLGGAVVVVDTFVVRQGGGRGCAMQGAHLLQFPHPSHLHHRSAPEAMLHAALILCHPPHRRHPQRARCDHCHCGSEVVSTACHPGRLSASSETHGNQLWGYWPRHVAHCHMHPAPHLHRKALVRTLLRYYHGRCQMHCAGAYALYHHPHSGPAHSHEEVVFLHASAHQSDSVHVVQAIEQHTK